MHLDATRATAALAPIADALDSDVIRTALGTIRIVNAAMARAVRTISVERGHNPRDFALVAFGGAGPLHAVQLAHELGMERVIVPRYPGVLSALGMVTAAVTRSATRAILQPLAQLTADHVNALVTSTNAELTDALQHDGESLHTFNHTLVLAMRYHGQVFELDVPLHGDMPHTPVVDAELLQQAATSFHALHQRRYGYALAERPLEVVQLQHTMASAATPLPVPTVSMRHTPLQPHAYVQAYLNDDTRAVRTAIYQRADLCAGDHIAGPAVITQLDATTIIPSDWDAVVTPVETLVITRR
jgi:N-methylhydantoinase A